MECARIAPGCARILEFMRTHYTWMRTHYGVLCARIMRFLEECFEMDDTLKVEGQVEEPKVGMIFNSIAEAKECYRRYGNEKGFSIKNRSSKRNDDGECIYVIFSCNYACKPKSRNPYQKHPSKKTDCKAKLIISICADGKWIVTIFTRDHNHALSPGDFCLRSWGKKKIANKNLILNDKVMRLRIGQGDASAIQNYLMKMQTNDPNFFYVIDFDDEGYLRNAFWADARSRAVYEEWSDAITFDTSYLTNNYDLTLAPFLGVNHHGQPMLLGCGLLSNEDTETFTWLFQCWLACMSGCAPKTIVTDLGKTMQKAVETVFPNTRHIWCLWHIIKKLAGKLRSNKQSDSIKIAFQNIVYDSLTCDEFEYCWNRMIGNYNLQSNEWFLDLYIERHRWVPIFLKDTFCAGMSTTKRTESINAFFDGFVNSKTTIKQFVEQYENALCIKFQKEKQEDLSSLNSVVPCITHYAMEKQFQDAYTTTKFKEFQHELRGKIYCEISSVKKDAVCSEYEIVEDLKVGETDKSEAFRVSLTHDDCSVYCRCCLFESRGILCRHAIVVLIHNKILRVPEKYIIPRWRKDLKRHYTKVKMSYDDCSGKPEACRYDKMYNVFSEIADLSIDFEDKTKLVMDWINETKKVLRRDEDFWRDQPTIVMNHGTTATRGDVISISPAYKTKQPTTIQVGKNTENRKTGSKRRNSIDGNNIQELQMVECEEVGYVGGEIFGTQPSIDFQDSGIRSHGMHIGGSHDALTTVHFADANLTLWGVPPNAGQPNILCGNIFDPPKLAYGHGFR